MAKNFELSRGTAKWQQGGSKGRLLSAKVQLALRAALSRYDGERLPGEEDVAPENITLPFGLLPEFAGTRKTVLVAWDEAVAFTKPISVCGTRLLS